MGGMTGVKGRREARESMPRLCAACWYAAGIGAVCGLISSRPPRESISIGRMNCSMGVPRSSGVKTGRSEGR